jgi:LysM repeat protein
LERLFDTQSADFSEEMRRSFLLGALSNHSTTAARILLKTDFTFALKKLEDKALLDILSLLKQQSAESTKFCVELLRAPRSDAIWQAAAMTLYAYVGEMPTLPLDTKSALARFSATPTQAAPVQELKLPTQSRFHTVMEGESLWKISRRYDVKVEEIVQINGLENTSLFPGMTLKLP